MKPWTLARLEARLPGSRRRGEAEVRRLQIDSRRVRPGDLFAALPGAHHHGLDFLPQVLEAGAAGVLAPAGAVISDDVPVLFSEDVFGDAGLAAHLLAGDPTKAWPLLAVTGTNGKTTSAMLLAHMLSRGGREWGLIGSVDYRVGGRSLPASHTTPDAARLAAYLAEMREAGRVGAVMEASSHAIAQKRIAGCRYAGALFTNLSRDHLDYHGTMEAYCEAKRGLLDQLESGAPAVFNRDDPWMTRLGEGRGNAVYFGRDAGADLRTVKGQCTADGSRLELDWRGARLEFDSPLLGEFNLENVAGALALALALGEEPEALASALVSFPGVPGRMERLEAPGGPAVILDFAHTPDAIEKVAAACRPLCAGEMRVLFGAGGDRDRGKRPLMAKAAQALADRVILTSDNPRGEDPEAILDEVEAGLDPAAAPWTRLADRRSAIAAALDGAGEGDMVLLLGKGHERTQEIAGVKHPFNDREIAREILEKGGRA